MKSALFALAAVPALGQILNIPDDNRMVQEGGILRFPISVSEGAPAVKNITKRQNDVALTSQQTGYFYTIDVTLGTPGQTVKVNFDTGSSELWVNPVCSRSNDPEFCESFGRFESSTSFVSTGETGTITYGTGYVDFEYGYDYATIGSAKINQQVFGVATDSEFSSVGIMGAGPALEGWENRYPLIIDNLAAQGFINSRAFSLDIRTLQSARGSVVFGGIDTKKYSGSLEKLPIVPAASSPDGYTRYWVNLDGIAITQDDGSKDTVFDQVAGLTVLLDSGYTVSALPAAMFQALVDAFPTAQPYPGSDMYEVDCSVADLEGTVDFTFGSTIIKVPFSDFIWQQPQAGICLLGAFQDDEFPVLGDTFLRAAYVVYDWDNRNVHIANNEDCGSKLVAIGTGPDAVPSLVGECGSSSTTTSSSTTSTSTSTSSSSTTTTSTEASTTAFSSTTEVSSTEVSSTTDVSSTEVSSTETEVSSTETEASSTAEASETETETSYTSTEEHTFTSTHYTNSTTSFSKTTESKTSVTEAPTTITSTFTTTSVYTITSCPPEVTKCPVGKVTTEVITSYTTFCPATTAAPKPTDSITKTFTTTKTYTVTDCPGEGPCHKGELTTEVCTTTTLVCPEKTATYTFTKTITCHKGQDDCEEGQTKTRTHTITVEPNPTNKVPKPIPGCPDCEHKPIYTSSAKVFTPTVKKNETPEPTGKVHKPTGKVETATAIVTKTSGCYGPECPVETAPPVVTAGAAGVAAPGVVAMVMGALVAAAL